MGRGFVEKRANVKLDRYLHLNRVEPVPPPVRLEYSRLGPPPRGALGRAALVVLFGAGVKLAIAFGCLGVAFAVGLWLEPAVLAGVLLVSFSIGSLMMLVAMVRR